MRVLAAAGAALAAVCGGVIVRRLYGLREGLLTAGLIALGPYFLVNASVGIYDAMVTGLVAARDHDRDPAGSAAPARHRRSPSASPSARAA